MDRKTFFKKGLGKFFGSVVRETNEVIDEIQQEFHKTGESLQQIETDFEEDFLFPEMETAKPINKNLKFPPGAIPGKREFKKICTGCGDCLAACPYLVIFPVYEAHIAKSIPYLDTNATACMLCETWPCIQSCKPKALKKLKKNQLPKFGQARAVFDHCFNQPNEQENCSDCRTSCPIDEVIHFKKGKPSFARSCSGCGICIQACPAVPKAIVIK